MDLVDEQIDAVSQSMLGLTLACARCHDHKFDPVTQRDYYALAGIFLSSETLYGTYSQLQNANPSTLIELDREADQVSALAKISPGEVAQL
jgi:cytochrome c553